MDKSGDAHEYVSDNPGQSLLIAAGIGLLAGLAVAVAAPRRERSSYYPAAARRPVENTLHRPAE